MSRSKFMDCLDDSCRAASEGRMREYVVKRIFTPEGLGAPHVELECASCGRKYVEVIPRSRVRKRAWPYYNDSTGVTFESESHEKSYVKENKLEAV